MNIFVEGADLAYELLQTLASRMINEVNRVVYDKSKPQRAIGGS